MSNTTKECPSCGTTKGISDFPKKRNICSECLRVNRRKRISSSYELYLRNLYSKSKHAVTADRKNKNREWLITSDDLITMWHKQKGRCALSGIYLTHHLDGSGRKEHNASIDRISQDKGYTVSNVQLVCFRINLMKHNLPEDMFFWWIKTIADFSCD